MFCLFWSFRSYNKFFDPLWIYCHIVWEIDIYVCKFSFPSLESLFLLSFFNLCPEWCGYSCEGLFTSPLFHSIIYVWFCARTILLCYCGSVIYSKIRYCDISSIVLSAKDVYLFGFCASTCITELFSVFVVLFCCCSVKNDIEILIEIVFDMKDSFWQYNSSHNINSVKSWSRTVFPSSGVF